MTAARTALAAALAVGVVGVGVADAHVQVLPDTVTQDVEQQFTIRVPNELPSADLVRVRVVFPRQVTVASFAEPPRPWVLAPIVARNGRIRGVDVHGGRIRPGRYLDVQVLGTPFGTGTSVWPTYVTDSAGAVKPWTGPPEAPGVDAPETGPSQPGPAPAVRIVAAETATAAVGGRATGSSRAGVWLGVIAIAIAGLAAVGTGLLWATRPARLPPDGPEDSP